jgi:hypothetical protein
MTKKRTARRTPIKKAEPKVDWGDAFIDALASGGNVRAACLKAGIGRTAAYARRRDELAFHDAWETAMEEATDILEEEARRRAYGGIEKTVYGSGGPGVGTVEVGVAKEYSDTLLIFLLKAHRPEKFRENMRIVHDGTVKHRHSMKAEDMSDDQLAGIASRAVARPGRRRAAPTPEGA